MATAESTSETAVNVKGLVAVTPNSRLEPARPSHRAPTSPSARPWSGWRASAPHRSSSGTCRRPVRRGPCAGRFPACASRRSTGRARSIPTAAISNATTEKPARSEVREATLREVASELLFERRHPIQIGARLLTRDARPPEVPRPSPVGCPTRSRTSTSALWGGFCARATKICGTASRSCPCNRMSVTTPATVCHGWSESRVPNLNRRPTGSPGGARASHRLVDDRNPRSIGPVPERKVAASEQRRAEGCEKIRTDLVHPETR